MLVPSDPELLALWEQGAARHPIDRALLLAAQARTDLPADAVADLPLGALNAALLRLRAALFGDRIEAYADCPACGTRFGLDLAAAGLLAGVSVADDPGRVQVGACSLRAPTGRDLAAVAVLPDANAAALALLGRCCQSDQRGAPGDAPAGDGMADLLEQAEAALDALDPGAELALTLTCDACGTPWLADLDPGALLWGELAARAQALLGEVHCLARAYGWSEHQVLGLSPQRRAAYLGLVGAT